MDNTFLASVEQEGSLSNSARTDEEGKETPPASPAETKPKEDTTAPPVEGKSEGETGEPKPGEKPEVFHAFHKHPRWLAAQEELKDLREFKEKAEPLITDLLDKGKDAGNKDTSVPKWFIALFGENIEAWEQYSVYTSEERRRMREEIMSEFDERLKAGEEERKKWDKWVGDQLNNVLEDENVRARAKMAGFDIANKEQEKMLRNELLNTAVKYQPSDEEGNISLTKAFDILEMEKLAKKGVKPPADEKRKHIAGNTMGEGKGEEGKKDYKTSQDLAGKSFRDLIPEIN